MSFHRRWFLTAAGSAFLASIAGIVEAAKKEPVRKKSGDPVKDAQMIIDDFKLGYGNLSSAEEQICMKFLDDTYRGRWDDRYLSLSQKEVSDLSGMAGTLGRLTKGALLNERNGTCGWKKNEKAVLREAHLQHARDMLGFHLNPRVSNGKRCGTALPVSIKQPDQPCPICPV